MGDKIAEIIESYLFKEGYNSILFRKVKKTSAEIRRYIKDVGEKLIEEYSSDDNLLIKGVHEIEGVKELMKRLEGE